MLNVFAASLLVACEPSCPKGEVGDGDGCLPPVRGTFGMAGVGAPAPVMAAVGGTTSAPSVSGSAGTSMPGAPVVVTVVVPGTSGAATPAQAASPPSASAGMPTPPQAGTGGAATMMSAMATMPAGGAAGKAAPAAMAGSMAVPPANGAAGKAAPAALAGSMAVPAANGAAGKAAPAAMAGTTARPAAPATTSGGTAASPPPATPTNNTAQPKAPACGNKVREGAELCDGNCPTTCPSTSACMPAKLTGSAATCDAQCKVTEIHDCKSGDGCCPAGCSNTTDTDCQSKCGNGVLDPGEKCDPRSSTSCPTSCDDQDPCTKDTLEGAAASCTATCVHTPITTAVSGDGCCLASSGPSDSDCQPSCGDGVVSGKETCDPRSNVQCPTSCDDGVACTKDELTGSAADCSASCSHSPAEASFDDDGCCPPGANANTDADCAPRCGNGIEEIGEDCDYAAPGQVANVTCDPGCYRILPASCTSGADCSSGNCKDGECAP